MCGEVLNSYFFLLRRETPWRKKNRYINIFVVIQITKLKEEQFESLGLDTLTVSLDLKMNRANISRLLNQLYNEGRLIKTVQDRYSLWTGQHWTAM